MQLLVLRTGDLVALECYISYHRDHACMSVGRVFTYLRMVVVDFSTTLFFFSTRRRERETKYGTNFKNNNTIQHEGSSLLYTITYLRIKRDQYFSCCPTTKKELVLYISSKKPCPFFCLWRETDSPLLGLSNIMRHLDPAALFIGFFKLLAAISKTRY